MQRQNVSSSRMNSVGWSSNTLEVEFKDGSVYQYHDVNNTEYQDFMNSTSLGSALSKLDKKHPYNRV